ncbi:T-cell immunoglobulin and mucin domain-containing protein 4-like [Seriola aureovittata]|uniref:T-cell immunoglobulin and mucin domain-containing protein 4-like n=1 Tax=Seriola aureovittata TaxID=2871759 RepID=UPI0024BEDF0B|nr:T-cell immunoglobulin and mucin domain-containing protein 4-like [Seriola aureovittata]
MRGLCFFFLSILTRVSPTSSGVIGFIGHNVTLPCRYDAQSHGVLSFCWGRGEVPRSKCSDTILSSEDGAVNLRKSSRYQLLGRVTDGDISLTILNAQWSDIGVYGCRVEIPGWFNDYKANTNLVMEEAPVEQPITQDWSLTGGRHDEQSETWTASAEVGDPTLGIIRSEEKFKAFLRVENIARMGAIFFSTIIIILVFIFLGRRFQSRGTLEHLNASAAENIYESVPVPE